MDAVTGSDTLAGEGVTDGSSLMIEQCPSLAASDYSLVLRYYGVRWRVRKVLIEAARS